MCEVAHQLSLGWGRLLKSAESKVATIYTKLIDLKGYNLMTIR